MRDVSNLIFLIANCQLLISIHLPSDFGAMFLLSCVRHGDLLFRIEMLSET